MAQDQISTWRPSGEPSPRPVGARSAAFAPFAGAADARDSDVFTFDLAEMGQVLWKRRYVIGVVFAVILVLGVLYTLLATPIYRASVTLQIDRESVKVVSGAEGLQPEELQTGDEFYQTQYGLLKARFLAEKVVDALRIDSSDQDMKWMGWRAKAFRNLTDADRRGRRHQIAVSLVQKHIIVAPVRGSRLVRVSFDSRSPAFSAAVANALGENFISANLDRRFEAASYARDFLEQHLNEEREKLEASERAAVAYAADQKIISLPIPQGEGGPPTSSTESLVAADLSALNQDLTQATNARIAAEEQWREAQTTPGRNLPEVLANLTIQQLLQQRAIIAAQYEQNLATLKPDHPTMRQLKAQLAEMDSEIAAQILAIQKSIKNQYETAVAQQQALQDKVDKLKSAMIDLNNRSIQYNILQREVDTNRSLYEGLLQRYKEVGIAGGVGTNNISIVDTALAPTKPAVPNVPIYLSVTFALGLIGGIGAAFLLEALDQGVNAPSEVETKLHIPALGAVPATERGVSPALALQDPRSGISEAVNAIRTGLQFSTTDGAPRTLLVTSSRSSEGKTTTAAALAGSFARLGNRVLLVDGDLRNPSLHRLMGVKNANGLSRRLAGAATLDEIVQPTKEPNLSVVTCGPLPPNPSELLAGPGLAAFLEEAQQKFDLVLVDGPPVVGLSDAVSLSAAVVGVLFVVEAVKVRRAAAREAIRRLEAVDARIVGGVLCKFNARMAAYGYEYEYHYAYGGRKRAS